MNLQTSLHYAHSSVQTEKSSGSESLFLAALPTQDYERLKPHLEHIQLRIGDILHTPDEPIRYVYFPKNSVISIVTQLIEGTTIETGIIGTEGLLGSTVVLSDDNVATREANVQVAGSAWRMKTQTFKAEFERCAALNRFVLRFILAFVAQISQNAACTQHHRIEARLARWLLKIQDRVQSNELYITQEFIALMLGVHRQSVTITASSLKEQGLIQYSRGHITILNRKGLEDTTCECYQAIKGAYNKYLNV